jgi:XTP/dITP diphosphohydrolase
MKILIATGNAGKFKEMMEVLSALPHEFVSLKDLGLENDVEETGSTYEENAFLKADYFFRHTGLPTIAEDSGLEVSALKGELGVKTRRWGAGEEASDQEWLEYFLERMQSEKDRSAKFLCCAVFVDSHAREIFQGESRGVLSEKPLCPIPHGIPVSALFIPEGKDTVFACMSQHEKNSVSHRGTAMKKLKEFLEKKR